MWFLTKWCVGCGVRNGIPWGVVFGQLKKKAFIFCLRVIIICLSRRKADRAGRPSAKQIGSRATLTILEKLEAREKKRAQQKKERKFTDRPPGAPRDCSANADFKGCPSC